MSQPHGPQHSVLENVITDLVELCSDLHDQEKRYQADSQEAREIGSNIEHIEDVIKKLEKHKHFSENSSKKKATDNADYLQILLEASAWLRIFIELIK